MHGSRNDEQDFRYERAVLKNLRAHTRELANIAKAVRRVACALEKQSEPRKPVSAAWRVGTPRQEGR